MLLNCFNTTEPVPLGRTVLLGFWTLRPDKLAYLARACINEGSSSSLFFQSSPVIHRKSSGPGRSRNRCHVAKRNETKMMKCCFETDLKKFSITHSSLRTSTMTRLFLISFLNIDKKLTGRCGYRQNFKFRNCLSLFASPQKEFSDNQNKTNAESFCHQVRFVWSHFNNNGQKKWPARWQHLSETRHRASILLHKVEF